MNYGVSVPSGPTALPTVLTLFVLSNLSPILGFCGTPNHPLLSSSFPSELLLLPMYSPSRYTIEEINTLF